MEQKTALRLKPSLHKPFDLAEQFLGRSSLPAKADIVRFISPPQQFMVWITC
ncbi:MAG: hypothetical protein JOZ78_21095 [Chroococcidiopsidaceae cyanobacterium CP_BM_ER_R8_30]|nr:hypothetical protein [Chroococcidiopsidaceae cyanobacterium CP_BM_ER_R8_30]